MRILIARTDAIGDTLLSLPMAQKIKETFPDASISFLVSGVSKDLFPHNPWVQQVWEWSHSWAFPKKLQLWRKITKDFAPTHYFYVGGSHLPSIFAFLNRIKFRGGLLSRWPSFLFLNKGVRQRRSLIEMHETDYNFQLLKPLGVNYSQEDRPSLTPKLYLQDEEQSDFENDFILLLKTANFDLTKTRILIHPGRAGHTLNWPAKNYARLVRMFEGRFPDRYTYIFSYTAQDSGYIKEIQSYFEKDEYLFLKEKCLFFDGSTKGLRYYMALIKSAGLFVGPSTGPTHMANALKVPLIALFSPIAVQSAMRWGPFNRDESLTQVIVPDVICGERFKCAGQICSYYKCMKKITVEDVFHRAQKLLSSEEK